MKKILILLLSLLMVLCAVACNKDGAPDGMMNVAIESVQFNLYVPEDTWLSIASSGISGARVYSNEDFSNVTVTVYYPEETLSAEDYWNKKCLQNYSTYFTEFTLLEEQCGDTTLGGLNAKRYVDEGKLGEEAYRYMQVITVRDTMIYTLTYTAKTDLYDSHAEDVESIRASFTFR